MTSSPWTDLEVREKKQDRLCFGHYCQVLSEIVTEADTPLTIGIFGPWGSGKTSLMRLVEEKLKSAQPAPLTVWFNAWKYDQEEALWRALVIQVLNAFRPKPEVNNKPQIATAPGTQQLLPDKPAGEPSLTPEQQKLNQRLDDLEASLYRTVEREEIGGVSIDWEKLLRGSIMGITHLSLSALPGVGAILGKMMEKAQEQITGEDINTIFEAIQRERRKIHREQIRSLEQFQQNFEALVKAEVVDKQRRLVVFIDDLDRCLPEKAIQVLEALKLFLDVPGCLFFMAADREVIQRGIRVKYKDFLVDSDDPVAANRRIPITGINYLEKIIQLPFHLLPLDEEQVEQFVSQSGSKLPDGCADLFAAGLEANPRKVKRALNIFRLTYKLAQLRQKEFKVNDKPIQIKPQLLAKVVVIQSRYSDLYNDLVEYPALLPDLERHFNSGEPTPAAPSAPLQPPTEIHIQESNNIVLNMEAALPVAAGGSKTLLEKYAHLRPLQRLLSRGEHFADLPLAEVKLYLYLTYTTDESRQTSAAENLMTRWWAELLSNDPTKIRSAISAIQEEDKKLAGTTAKFVQQLLQALEYADEPYQSYQRVSAGAALALLGDPRDFDQMVSIPAGEYPLGEDGQLHHLEGFKIGKYPVTCKQYKKFLEENPTHSIPPYWDQNTRVYPAELANHPVVSVSWNDAQVYCRWAAKRLPSKEEWEAAARGPQGYRYPYGNEIQPNANNTFESGLQGTSPVGAFPAGASPFGIMDMAGNIWEWTNSSDQGNYALKGGAWNVPSAELGSFNSWWQSPHTSTSAIGFRVAE